MFSVLYEYHYLSSLPDLFGRAQSLNEYVRQMQLERFLVSMPDELEGRRWRRISVRENATLMTVDNARRTLVVDVSVTGFRISGTSGLQELDYVELRGNGYAFPCRVIWREQQLDQVGLALSGLPRALPAAGGVVPPS